MPFAGYTNFEECVSQNRDKGDPDAYCGSIKHKVEDKMVKKAAQRKAQVVRAGRAPEGVVRLKRAAVVEPRDLLGAVGKALDAVGMGRDPASVATAIVKALEGPVQEEGDKKLTGEGNEGTQDDQAFAVAHGPDNYDALVKQAERAQMGNVVKSVGRVGAALSHDIEMRGILRKQGPTAMNMPGNLKEHLQKALAAVHGREIFDPRYKQACKLLKKVCDLMEAIERQGEVAQGGAPTQLPGMGMNQPAGPDPRAVAGH